MWHRDRPKMAALLGPGVATNIPIAVTAHHDLDIALPMSDPLRYVCLGRRDAEDARAGDSPYVAFAVYARNEDHQAHMSKYTEGMTPVQRLLFVLQVTGTPLDPEPELPNEIKVMDGGRAVIVDLDLVLPNHVLHVAEEYIP